MTKRSKKNSADSRGLTAKLQDENQTLASVLRRWFPQESWNQVKKWITGRTITVNGNLCMDAGRRLKAGDHVKRLAQAAAAPPKEEDVKVAYLDEHLIVVEKPAGLTTNRHREESDWPSRRRQTQPTLDELLPHVITKIEGRRGRRGVPPPVRAVHRLDRETSGLIVFARTPSAERHLAEQFRHHTTHRRYLAIVKGHVEAQTIRSHLVRDRGDGRRGSTDKPNVGKLAVTHVTPVEQGGAALETKAEGGRREAEENTGYTLIECRLETGRTHQIRIHLSENGHPVYGDKLYGQPKFADRPSDLKDASRMALHAAELGFIHPVTGKQLRFKTPLPKELAEMWNQLKGG